MEEDVKTIKKAMSQVNGLARKRDPQSLNQATRWINTKEAHASSIITVVAEYFLTQKVAEVSSSEDKKKYEDYLKTLALHHSVMKAAMKAKQSTNPDVADELAHHVDHLKQLYR